MAFGNRVLPPGPCPLCGAREWRPLDNILPDRSVRTDGGIVNAPLNKFHCEKCGLAHRPTTEQSLTELYTDSYQLYTNRPGAEQFDSRRYVNLATGMLDAWGRGDPPGRILEIGCGDGSLLQAIQSRWPAAECLGVEPSSSAVESARRRELNVLQGVIGDDLPAVVAAGGFDLIYTVHVIEHTESPAAFLKAAAALLANTGRMVVTCPDGSIPHAELIHSDHLYSMTPAHLARFAEMSGADVLLQADCPTGSGAEFSQLMVCAKRTGPQSHVRRSEQPVGLYEKRQAYIGQWARLEAHLMSYLQDGIELYCFGAGGWASNIAGYCPALWEKVVACAVDGGAGAQVHGKVVQDYAALVDKELQFVIAVNPATQTRLSERLKSDGHMVLPWPQALNA